MQNDFPAARRSAESEKHKDPCDTINLPITDDLLTSMKGRYVAATQDDFLDE
jgi:hypothetical protein